MLLYTAAAVIVLLALAHSYLGERYLLIRLFKRAELPKLLGDTGFTKNTLRFVWHLVTWLSVALAAVLVQVQLQATPRQVVATIGIALVVSALLPLLFTRGRHLSWVFLLAAGVLCLYWAGS